MGPRNLLILFFSTVVISLVVLTIIFSLFFKNWNIELETRVPESAPDLGALYKKKEAGPDAPSEAAGVTHSTVNVPKDAPIPVEPAEDEEAPAEGIGVLEDGVIPAEEVLPDNGQDNGGLRPLIPGAENEPAIPLPGNPEPVIQPQPVQQARTFQVYLDGFQTRESAQATADQLKASGIEPFVRGAGNGYLVQVGVYSSRSNAEAMAAKLGAKVRPVQ